MIDNRVILLPVDEAVIRRSRLATAMCNCGIDLAVIKDNATIFYLTGRVFAGLVLLKADGEMVCCVQRPCHLVGERLIVVRKPEEIPARLPAGFLSGLTTAGYDWQTMSVGDYNRLAAVFEPLKGVNLAPAVRWARSVKTPYEIDLVAESGRRQAKVYAMIPSLYRPGMSDIELQIEIERELRRHGCLGQFRIAGDSMELYMGNIIAGDNADTPTPYDFAMGGGGMHPSLPVGANGTVIEPGMTVMVDANGNFTGYMTDMTRTFYCGDIPDEAVLAHEVSVEICDRLSAEAVPGVECSRLYRHAVEIAREAGLEDKFMGHRQQAGFVGHGLGIEINEAPVLAPRSRDVIEAGNLIAIEPKFVIPGVGAVGIENTYVVLPADSATATECVTNAPTQLIKL